VAGGPNGADRKKKAGHFARNDVAFVFGGIELEALERLMKYAHARSKGWLSGHEEPCCWGNRANRLLEKAGKKEGSFAVGFGDVLRVTALRMTWHFFGWIAMRGVGTFDR
jgi:hypothetical protein